MRVSRRDLSFLLPALVAAQAPASKDPSPSNTFHHQEITVRKSGAIRLELGIAGKTPPLGPGSAACRASNEQHGWRQVLALDGDKA